MKYEVGMNIEIIHLEGDEYNKYDGRIGTITNIKDGLLYGIKKHNADSIKLAQMVEAE